MNVTVPIDPTPEMLRAAFHSETLIEAWTAMLAARPAAPTQSAAQTGEVDSAKACGDRMVRVADALMPWLKNYPPSTRRERAIEAANAAISAALSQPEPSQ